MRRQIILAGLKARPVRTAVSVLAVAIEVTLILVISGLASGMVGESARRIAGIGADIMLQPPHASVLLSFNSSVMPQKLGDKLLEIEGIKAVAPVLVQINGQGGLEQVWGLDPASFDTVSGGFHYQQGAAFSSPDEIVVDDWYASAKKVKIGDRVEILNEKLRIAGIIDHGKGARIVMGLRAAQERTGSIDKASIFFIKLNNPSDYPAVAARLKEVLPEYTVINLPEYESLMTPDHLPGLSEFLQVVSFIAVSIGVLVIFLSMYTSITERTREIGVLRSLGSSKGVIVGLILEESVALCAIGAVAGLGLSYLVGRGIIMAFPTLSVNFTPGWITTALVLAILSGVIGSLYPSYKAARQDPIEALAYE
ncbi:MAG TPA: FtsX-like permease family protein [Terriglobia bacterium]|nr:FtsX-like permease family protein [Terriglobia bacterium]